MPNWGEVKGGGTKAGLLKLIVIDTQILEFTDMSHLSVIIIVLLVTSPNPPTDIFKLLAANAPIFILLIASLEPLISSKPLIDTSKLLVATVSGSSI